MKIIIINYIFVIIIIIILKYNKLWYIFIIITNSFYSVIDETRNFLLQNNIGSLGKLILLSKNR